MEIKVRAWDNHEKRWAKTHEIEGELFINPEADDTGVFYIHDKSASGKLHYTLVRSTGLRDKSGKEIYEGDICRFDVREGGVGEPAYHGLIGQVGFSFGCYTIGDFSSHYHSLEVIGHIYEGEKD